MKKYTKPSIEIVDLHVEDTITSNALGNLYKRGLYVGGTTATGGASNVDISGANAGSFSTGTGISA